MDTRPRNQLKRRFNTLDNLVENIGNELVDPLGPYSTDLDALLLAVAALDTTRSNLATIIGLVQTRALDQWPDDGETKISRRIGDQVAVAVLDPTTSYKKIRWTELVDAVDAQALLTKRPGETDDAARLRRREECFGNTGRWAKIADLGIDPDQYRDKTISTKVKVEVI